MENSEFTDNKLYYYLKVTHSTASRFYGHQRIHKPEVPVSPIVSYCGFLQR